MSKLLFAGVQKEVDRNTFMDWVTDHNFAEAIPTHGDNWSQMDWWDDGVLCGRAVYRYGGETRYFLFS